jgi:hypothetical protein
MAKLKKVKCELPSHVKIGPTMFEVRRRRIEKLGRVGLCSTDHGFLEVDSGIGETATKVTFLHEIIHAQLAACGIRGAHDEIVVEAIANKMIELFQDNPGLIEVLT